MTLFAVEQTELIREGLIVRGRIEEGAVCLGCIFTEVIGKDQFRRTILLTVKRIVAYGLSLEELRRGWTAELLLTGDGMEELEKSLLWTTISSTD